MERGDRHHRAGLVLFQGWGEKESDMTAPVPHLPVGPAYSSVRGPYVQGRHYAWFATGRPFAVIREHLVGHTVAPSYRTARARAPESSARYFHA